MNEDRAVRYHRLRRRAAIATTCLGAAWLLGLSVSGAAVWLARGVERVTAPWGAVAGRAAAIAGVVFVLACGYELLSLPLVFFRGLLLERKYGLSSETAVAWAADHAKGLVLGLLLSIAAAEAIYASIHVSGRWWWAISATLFVVAAILIANVAPVVLMPLFYRFRPLEREELRDRLLALSATANVRVLGVFEWGLGEKTTRANAALVGIGATRRILLSDTLLTQYSDDEIEVILAHELAHHVHHDIWTGLALETAVTAGALLAAALVVPDPSDLAALPLVVFVAATVSTLLTPLPNAWSRHNERRADRFALALTQMPAAFISAMRRLGAQNLAEEHPSRAVFWFFHTHPVIEERIDAARRFGIGDRDSIESAPW